MTAEPWPGKNRRIATEQIETLSQHSSEISQSEFLFVRKGHYFPYLPSTVNDLQQRASMSPLTQTSLQQIKVPILTPRLFWPTYLTSSCSNSQAVLAHTPPLVALTPRLFWFTPAYRCPAPTHTHILPVPLKLVRLFPPTVILCTQETTWKCDPPINLSFFPQSSLVQWFHCVKI